jgi:hypothetical protein
MSMANPAIKKRGGDPDVKRRPASQKSDDALERKLEEGLEETMAGSDPVSITQPSPSKIDKENIDKENIDKEHIDKEHEEKERS